MNKHSGNVLFFHFYPHDLGLFKYPFRSILSLPDIADAEDAASMHLRAAFVLSLTFNVRAQSQSTVGENRREAPFAAVTRPASSSAGVAASLLSTRISVWRTRALSRNPPRFRDQSLRKFEPSNSPLAFAIYTNFI